MVQTTRINSGGIDATDLAESIFGPGVTVQGASYTGDNRSAGLFSQGNSVPNTATPGDSGVILSTGRISNFFSNAGSNPNIRSNTSTNTQGVNNDAAFNALVGTRTFDAAWLDVDFTPTGDTLTMRFVFASEEYPEFSNSIYNDAVGVWLNGTPATLTVGDGSTSVGNVNQIDNLNLYKDNTGDAFSTEMDGFTVTMSLTLQVVPNVVNSIRIGIADLADSSYDSNLLIAADSLQTQLVATDDTIRLDPFTSRVLDVLGNDVSATGATLSIIEINGTPVQPNGEVLLPNGQRVRLNSDGTLTVIADADAEIAPFTYTATDGTLVDTAFVTVSTLPCFVTGTRILTPEGARPVEALRPGDMVVTQDDGPQPIRWVGSRTVQAEDDHAPIRISAHSLGIHKSLSVSPQHRVLIRDPQAELLFGETEVFVAAKHLVNDQTVQRVPGGEVTYVHLLLDRHHVIFAEGLATESFLPGPETTKGFDAAELARLTALFPGLDPETGAGYGPAARRILRGHETMLLAALTDLQGRPQAAAPDTLARAA